MTTSELKSIDMALDISSMALFAKASYCKVKPTEEKPNPSSVNTLEGARAALNDWFPSSGWEVIDVNGGINGFQAVAYGIDLNDDKLYDKVIIAYRGTDSILDLAWDDLLIALKIQPTQIQGAISFYNQIKSFGSLNSSAEISITGHSLGGALAQIVGAQTGCKTTTFNAPGMKNNVNRGDYSNITNYVNLNDWVGSYLEHVGNTHFYLPDGITDQGVFSPHSKFINDNSYYKDYEILVKDSEWKVEYSASIWGYDVDNKRVSGQQILASLKASPENLKKAVDIIQSKAGILDKLETTFHYLTPTGQNYVLGDKEGNTIELKNTLLGINEKGIVWGNGGNDNVKGIENEDILIGGKDSDTLIGGKGNDVLIAGETNHNIDRLSKDWTYREVLNINNFVADENTNTLYGEDGDDLLIGDNGQDYLDGGNDDDYLYGGNGDDELVGGNGNDNIKGGEGNDEIYGDDGEDTIYGENGDDTIVCRLGFNPTETINELENVA